MPIGPGTRLGPYEIAAKLGEGGMGEVYRARDTKLEREVAIKVLPAAFTEDHDRLARFEREAKLLAQLNHPNIAHIYGMEASGESHALVMELVESPTLAERLESGPLPLEESLLLARQIAEALEEAHEKGIIHRDLKPQNIKASIEGKVKVLDFGLAKAMDPGGALSSVEDLARSPTLLNSPTLTAAGTQLGVILGTAAYMSPEQARGQGVDKRADIWAFGVVLYEMLTGRSLFSAETVSDTLAGVLKSEIDLGALPESTPPALRRLLRRCLERNPRNRLHDIADARLVLEEVLSGRNVEGTAPQAETSAARRWPALAAVAAALALLAASAGWLLAPRSAMPERAAARHLSAVFPHELVVDSGLVAPDGSALLLSAARRDDPRRETAIYRRDLSDEKLVLVPGTAGVRGFLVTPDAREIVFIQPAATDPSARRVLRMPADGSRPPVEIARRDPAWSDLGLDADGEPVALVGRTRLTRVGADDGKGVPVPIDVGRAGLFSFEISPALPAGGGLLATMESWTGRGYQMSVARVDPATGKGEILIEDGGNAYFVPPDRLLFTRGSTLHAVRFEPATGRVSGRPVALVEGLRIEEAWQAARFSVSGDGTLAYAPGGLVGAERRFAAYDPASGELEPWSAERRAFRLVSPSASPDGRATYAQLANATGTYEIWRVPREGPAQPIVALSEADAQAPVPSPDGRWIAFTRVARQPTDGIYLAPVDRSEPPRLLLARGDSERGLWPQSWTPDSRHLVVFQREGGDLSSLELSVEAPGVSRPLVPPQAWSVAVSPDGRRLAFVSDASGRAEVYVADYPESGPVGERVPVSRDGGEAPIWSPDGRTLYFNGRVSEILAAPIGADGRPTGAPRVVADREELAAPEEFGMLPDGRLLLIQRGPREGEIDRFDVVLHFDRILEERLP